MTKGELKTMIPNKMRVSEIRVNLLNGMSHYEKECEVEVTNRNLTLRVEKCDHFDFSMKTIMPFEFKHESIKSVDFIVES